MDTYIHCINMCILDLDIGSREVVLGHYVILDVDVISQGHTTGVYAKDASLCLLVGKGKLNFTINSTGTDQSGVQSVNAVSGHYHL